jgi:hypothetical protein
MSSPKRTNGLNAYEVKLLKKLENLKYRLEELVEMEAVPKEALVDLIQYLNVSLIVGQTLAGAADYTGELPFGGES